MKRIAFLFGAGCEGKGNFNLPSGITYFNDTFLCKKTADLKEPLKSKFNGNYFNFFNESYSFESNYITLEGNKKTILKNLLILNGVAEENVKKISDEFENEFIKLIDCYINVKNNKNEKFICENKELKKFLSENGQFNPDIFERKLNIGIAGILDKYFFTVVNPKEYGPRNYSKIFNFYWSCYFSIIGAILRECKNRNDGKYFEKYFMKDGDDVDYAKIINEIDEFTKTLYGKYEINKQDSYYDLIVKKLNLMNNSNHSKIECNGVITTNYFKFAEVVSKNIAYPNGRLCDFEFPEILDVADVSTEDVKDLIENKLYFPFIFGQSYVKPIIHSKQIEQYEKVMKILGLRKKGTIPNYLIVLGYNINDDDSHLNSFIREYIVLGGKLIFVTDSTKVDDILNRLRIEQSNKNSLIVMHVDYKIGNKKIVDEIFDLIIPK